MRASPRATSTFLILAPTWCDVLAHFGESRRDLVYRDQTYGVVVETLTNPARSRMGREYSVESL